jgi:hypothetical protein
VQGHPPQVFVRAIRLGHKNTEASGEIAGHGPSITPRVTGSVTHIGEGKTRTWLSIGCE